uniref:Uncharacterized protein n=1 Tax=Arundo donax TaxID=35708 RepID=A0A0A9H7R6_ARUDO
MLCVRRQSLQITGFHFARSTRWRQVTSCLLCQSS